jgi:hypothetical protein
MPYYGCVEIDPRFGFADSGEATAVRQIDFARIKYGVTLQRLKDFLGQKGADRASTD